MDSRHSNGLVAELKAATYYAEQGHEIYWPALTQSSVDFIAVKDGKTIRVQVKAAYWCANKIGKYEYSYLQATVRKGPGQSKNYCGYSDLDCDEVCVSHEGFLWVFPVSVMKTRQTVVLDRGHDSEKAYRKGSFDTAPYKVK